MNKFLTTAVLATLMFSVSGCSNKKVVDVEKANVLSELEQIKSQISRVESDVNQINNQVNNLDSEVKNLDQKVSAIPAVIKVPKYKK